MTVDDIFEVSYIHPVCVSWMLAHKSNYDTLDCLLSEFGWHMSSKSFKRHMQSGHNIFVETLLDRIEFPVRAFHIFEMTHNGSGQCVSTCIFCLLQVSETNQTISLVM